MMLNIKISCALVPILWILNIHGSFAQENFLQGRIITSETDTLNGYIDYRNWEKNPATISFKESIDSKSSSYSPLDLVAFKVKDEIYVSAIIDVETSSDQVDKLKEDPKLLVETDTAFLQTIFNGTKNLFYYKNSEGRESFYFRQHDEFILLIYKKYIKRINEAQKIVENNKYRGQLTVYLSDCQSIQSKLSSSKYDLQSLDQIFKYYYECVGSDVIFQKERDKAKIEIGLIGGASSSSIRFKGGRTKYLLEGDYERSTTITAGLFFDLVLARNQGKWSINNELLFTSYKTPGIYEVFRNENDFTRTDIDIAYSYLKLYTLARFKYPIGQFHIFINGGLSNGIAISVTNYRKEVEQIFTLERIKEGKAVEETRKYEQGFIVGLGLKLKRVSIETRIERGNGMSDLGKLNSIVNRYHFLLGYRFN